MRFCTAINCMDGRAQLPVIAYLRKRFHADFVDMVSEPGPNRVLAQGRDTSAIASIRRRVDISVQRHQSIGIAVVGHHDCAGNPAPAVQQNKDTTAAVLCVREAFRHVPVIGLWLNERWEVEELPDAPASKADDGD